LDHARELAAEQGFISEDGDINELLYALVAESRGEDIVRASQLTEAQKRRAVMEYNEQVTQQNQLVLENSKDIRTLKEALRRGATAARKDVKAVQGSIISALSKTPLRAADKAKFISTIKNVQTSEQLEKQLPKIEKRVNELVDAESKRRIRNLIRERASEAKAGDKTAVESLADIRELEDRLKGNGILSGAPNDTADMDGAERSPSMRDLTVKEFQDALADALMLTKQGRARQFLKEQMKVQRRQQRLEDLAADTKPIESRKYLRNAIGERVTAMQKVKLLMLDGMNKAQALGLNKSPMDVIFDILDGAKDYTGANFRIFKQAMDRGFGRYLTRKRDVQERVMELHDSLKLDSTNYERIGVWAAMQQEGGYDHLIGSGDTEADMEKLAKRYENGGENQEARNELRMYEAMRTELDNLRDPIAQVLATVYNKDLKKVKNYFSFMADHEAMGSVEVQNRFGDDAFIVGQDKAEFNKKDIKKGFTKERQGGRTAIKLNALEVFMKHVDNATYLIAMGQDVKELGELAASREYLDISGNVGQEIVVDWINLIARKGNISGRQTVFDSLRRNVGAAMLGFKLSSTLIQGTALMDGASLVGGDYVLGHGVKDFCKREWREFIIGNMPELRERIGDDAAYRELEGDGILSNVRDAGM